MKPRNFTAIVALLLLAPVAYAGGASNAPDANQPSSDSQSQPKSPCSVPCVVMRVSTAARCECSVRKTLPA